MPLSFWAEILGICIGTCSAASRGWKELGVIHGPFYSRKHSIPLIPTVPTLGKQQPNKVSTAGSKALLPPDIKSRKGAEPRAEKGPGRWSTGGNGKRCHETHWKFRDFWTSFPLNLEQGASMSIFHRKQQQNKLCFKSSKRLWFDNLEVLQCEYWMPYA